jgi:hypothetical protein
MLIANASATMTEISCLEAPLMAVEPGADFMFELLSNVCILLTP